MEKVMPKAQSQEPFVKVEINNSVALLTLNRPDSLNALSTAMRAGIVEAINSVNDNDTVKAIVLTGEGRAFCAGLDLKELGSGKADNEDAVSDSNMLKAFYNLNKPVIGAINGFAITGGFELALMTDFMIAGENAKFADTHARIGIVPGWGLSQKLPRIIGIGRAKELSFTGNFLDAKQAEQWGLVNCVVKNKHLVSTCLKLAEDIASCEPTTLKTYKSIIDQGYETTLFDGIRIEAKANKAHMQDVTPEALEERRKVVMSRGRDQK
jgi:enoyl-CoA hydratase